MSYKTILICLNEVGRLAELTAAATCLAQETGAHVSGLYVVPAVQVYPSVGFEAVPQVFEGNRSFFKANAQRVRQVFEEAMRCESLSHDFHLLEARTPVIAEEVIAMGRSADVVVVSATDPEEITGVERDFVEQVLMAVGRPVIVLPAKADARLVLNKIVVGWDGGREAARAAFDALPLLKRAEKVLIVRVDPQKDPALRGSIVGADLAQSLSRHGLNVETQGYPTEGLDEGQALMRCAEDNDCGLIVMGAYGHSRLAEFIFGGATRFVLNRMTRPVLMSH
jgi:nucleotide-binding universal stress UspA family protein